MVTRLREKGQITIPAKIRDALNLSKDSVLSVAKAGEAIILFPRPSKFDETAKEFSKQARKSGVTLESLLRDLRKLRLKKI